MSHTLFGDLHLEAGKGTFYWWPLIFEALGEGSFHLSTPGQPQGIVSYWHRQPKPPGGLQHVTVPFRALWDEICGEVTDLRIIFWLSGEDDVYLDVALHYQQESRDERHVRIGVAFAGANVMEESTEEAKYRLGKVLDALKRLHVVCQARWGELYWEHAGSAYAPWVTFGRPPEPPTRERPMLPGPERKLIQQAVPGGGQVYLLDPVPIARLREEWEFVSLME